jgi:hypothetical protein
MFYTNCFSRYTSEIYWQQKLFKELKVSYYLRIKEITMSRMLADLWSRRDIYLPYLSTKKSLGMQYDLCQSLVLNHVILNFSNWYTMCFYFDLNSRHNEVTDSPYLLIPLTFWMQSCFHRKCFLDFSFSVMTIKSAIFCDTMPRQLEKFTVWRNALLQLSELKDNPSKQLAISLLGSLLNPEDWSSMFLQNIYKLLLDYHPTRL